MKLHALLFAGLVALSSTCDARIMAQTEGSTLAGRATVNAQKITDVESFLEEINDSLRMARAGEYGRLQGSDLRRLEIQRDIIARLLEGHSSALELPPAERIELFNAQESIVARLRSDDKNRKVCKREATTGSRLTTVECLTVAQREDRAKIARESAFGIQRNVCYKGEGNACGQ